ncbi:MAG: hypothetical protein AAGF90_08590, partial [Pseudomonadota bacterium]
DSKSTAQMEGAAVEPGADGGDPTEDLAAFEPNDGVGVAEDAMDESPSPSATDAVAANADVGERDDADWAEASPSADESPVDSMGVDTAAEEALDIAAGPGFGDDDDDASSFASPKVDVDMSLAESAEAGSEEGREADFSAALSLEEEAATEPSLDAPRSDVDGFSPEPDLDGGSVGEASSIDMALELHDASAPPSDDVDGDEAPPQSLEPEADETGDAAQPEADLDAFEAPLDDDVVAPSTDASADDDEESAAFEGADPFTLDAATDFELPDFGESDGDDAHAAPNFDLLAGEPLAESDR